MATSGFGAETCSALASARAYVIYKSDDGITVGLHLDGGRYGEACSPEGDVDRAVREALARARVQPRPPPATGDRD